MEVDSISNSASKNRLRHPISLLVFLGLIAVSLVTVLMVQQGQDIRQRAQIADCPSGIPTGALEGQPPPIWCKEPLALGQTTFIQGGNFWIDEFNHGLSFAEIGNGYTPYNFGNMTRSKYWRHADHWMVDVQNKNKMAGTMLKPNKAFRFVNGKLVVEAVAAAGISGYHQDVGEIGGIWPEIVIATAPQPSSNPHDIFYGYEQFPGAFSIGCRIDSHGTIICAMFDDGSVTGGTRGERIWEMAFWLPFGTTNFGGGRFGDLADAFRLCNSNQDPDTLCRDTFRLELTKTSLTLFVNNIKYFEQTGLSGRNALPDKFLNSDIYVYLTSTAHFPTKDTVRFHWDRVAVNPALAIGVTPTVTTTQPSPTPTKTPTPTTQPTGAQSDLSFSPATQTVANGSTFPVQVRVNTNGQSVNAVQANITYPSTLLEVVSVSNSGGSFEIEAQKTIGASSMNLAYGTTTAKSGNLLIATINFRSKAAGSATVSYANTSAVVSSITNTNVLRNRTSGTYTISTTAPTPTPTTVPGKTGDLNNDGNVNLTDLSILLSNWNSTSPTADINKDGSVNLTDLSMLLSNWGT